MKTLGALLLLTGGACAPTTSSSAPLVEVLVVASDGEQRSLLLVPTDRIDSTTTIPLGVGAGHLTTLAVRGRYAIAGLAEADQVMVVDLVTHDVRTLSLNTGGIVSEVGFSDDGLGFATAPGVGALVRFDPVGGAISRTFYASGPRDAVSVRGRLFVAFGSLQECTPQSETCVAETSWLSVFPSSSPADSIPMSGSGNPVAAEMAQDGILYVLNRGGGSSSGRLAAIDPVKREEVSSFAEFGLAPSLLVFDGVDRMLIASRTEGLMVFNTRERRVERGAGHGIPLPRRPRALVTDAVGRIYVVEAEGCGGTVQGVVRVFGHDLVEGRTISAGSCPAAAAVTEIPAGESPA